MTRPTLEWLSRTAFVLAVAACLGTMSLLALHALPNGDDFCRGRLLPLISTVQGWHTAGGSLEYVSDSWVHWTGRWLAMVLETAVLPSIDITRHYAALILCTWVVLLAGLLLVIREALTASARARTVVASTLVVWVLLWSKVPKTGDSLFWFTGAVENLLPITTGCVVVALLARSSRATGRLRSGLRVAAAAGALSVPGLHELHGLSLFVVLTLCAFLALRRTPGDAAPWLLCATLAMVGAMVVVLAPGNGVRAGMLPTASPAVAARLTALQLVRHLPGWVLDLPLLAATTAFVLHPTVRSLRPAWIETHLPGWRAALVPLTTLCLVVVGFLAPSYALSATAPTRTVAGVYLVFLIGWFATVFTMTRRSAAIAEAPRLADGLVAAALLLFAGGVVIDGNTRRGLWDLRHSAREWNASMRSRYETLRAVEGSRDTVSLARPGRAPLLFIAHDIEEDPSAWRNECVAGYFGVAAVVLSADAGPRGARRDPEPPVD